MTNEGKIYTCPKCKKVQNHVPFETKDGPIWKMQCPNCFNWTPRIDWTTVARTDVVDFTDKTREEFEAWCHDADGVALKICHSEWNTDELYITFTDWADDAKDPLRFDCIDSEGETDCWWARDTWQLYRDEPEQSETVETGAVDTRLEIAVDGLLEVLKDYQIKTGDTHPANEYWAGRFSMAYLSVVLARHSDPVRFSLLEGGDHE